MYSVDGLVIDNRLYDMSYVVALRVEVLSTEMDWIFRVRSFGGTPSQVVFFETISLFGFVCSPNGGSMRLQGPLLIEFYMYRQVSRLDAAKLLTLYEQ